ncbi:hypothetical protein DFH06DRAFT_1483783 [Mycena polygramma]|nr:hypothetical protein DFH06DRAFT_1483783 [Mycena polygramma]
MGTSCARKTRDAPRAAIRGLPLNWYILACLAFYCDGAPLASSGLSVSRCALLRVEALLTSLRGDNYKHWACTRAPDTRPSLSSRRPFVVNPRSVPPRVRWTGDASGSAPVTAHSQRPEASERMSPAACAQAATDQALHGFSSRHPEPQSMSRSRPMPRSALDTRQSSLSQTASERLSTPILRRGGRYGSLTRVRLPALLSAVEVEVELSFTLPMSRIPPALRSSVSYTLVAHIACSLTDSKSRTSCIPLRALSALAPPVLHAAVCSVRTSLHARCISQPLQHTRTAALSSARPISADTSSFPRSRPLPANALDSTRVAAALPRAADVSCARQRATYAPLLNPHTRIRRPSMKYRPRSTLLRAPPPACPILARDRSHSMECDWRWRPPCTLSPRTRTMPSLLLARRSRLRVASSAVVPRTSRQTAVDTRAAPVLPGWRCASRCPSRRARPRWIRARRGLGLLRFSVFLKRAPPPLRRSRAPWATRVEVRSSSRAHPYPALVSRLGRGADAQDVSADRMRVRTPRRMGGDSLRRWDAFCMWRGGCRVSHCLYASHRLLYFWRSTTHLRPSPFLDNVLLPPCAGWYHPTCSPCLRSSPAPAACRPRAPAAGVGYSPSTDVTHYIYRPDQVEYTFPALRSRKTRVALLLPTIAVRVRSSNLGIPQRLPVTFSRAGRVHARAALRVRSLERALLALGILSCPGARTSMCARRSCASRRSTHDPI